MPGERRALDAKRPVSGPWWQRVVPLATIAVVAALAAVALGGSSDVVRLSTTRQEQPFVELGLTRSPDDVCSRATVRVRYVVTSHLDQAESLDLRVAVDPVRDGQRARSRNGRVTIQPEGTVSIRTQLAAPRGPYDVSVTIAGRPERLAVHCDAKGGVR